MSPELGKRKAERFALSLPARVSAGKKAHEKKVIDLMTKDICSGGAFFHTDQAMPLGTQVTIDLVLPLDELKKLEGKKASVKVTGAVIRVDQKGMAICFDKNFKISAIPD